MVQDLFGAFLALMQFPDPQAAASAVQEAVAAAAVAKASAAGTPAKRRRSATCLSMLSVQLIIVLQSHFEITLVRLLP